MSLIATLAKKHGLLPSVTCPHCWHTFPPEKMLWISAHQDLYTDRKIPDHALRFLPTRFDPLGNAIDAKDFVCHGIACPNCHLPIHRGLIEVEPLFCSIVGTPSCGKSYYLASLIHQMKQVAATDHFLQFTDLDTEANDYIVRLEQALFLNPDEQGAKALGKLIAKTGDKVADNPALYNRVHFGDQEIVYTKPYLYLMTLRQHGLYRSVKNTASRVLCLYDNAGEHFLAGADKVSFQATRHLAKSQVLFFLFDPTQDVRFLKACLAYWNQAKQHEDQTQRERELKVIQHSCSDKQFRQDSVLQEAANRVRTLVGLKQQEIYKRHLIIILTKADLWAEFAEKELSTPAEPFKLLKSPFQEHRITHKDSLLATFKALDTEHVSLVSSKLKSLLMKHCPDLVQTAKNFCERVTFIPVSALGSQPSATAEEVIDGKVKVLPTIAPKDITPQWVTVPLIYALHQYAPALMLRKMRKKPGAAGVAT